jgi:hypothetical protein
MDTSTTLHARAPTQAWMTVTHPPLPSPRPFRAFVVASCLAGALVAGGVVAALVHREGSSTAGVAAEASSPNRAGATVGGSATVPAYPGSSPAVPDRAPGWSPMTEAVVLSLIADEPALAVYERYCVLDVIQSRFATPLEFAEAARADRAQVNAVAVDVVNACQPSSRV